MLRLQQLTKKFFLDGSLLAVHAVNEIDGSIGVGETLGLVGESGSGKTTVGRCIVELEKPTSGKILFHGQDITKLDKAESREYRKHIQMVFQDAHNSLHPRMTVRESLCIPIRLWRTKNRQRIASIVEELVQMVGIDSGNLDAYRHHLGSGEKQRVAIARALATQPSLIVLDEPTSALDPNARTEIITLLQRFRKDSSVACLFISHDITAVRSVADRIAVMYLGKIVEEGPTDNIVRSPYHPYTRMLMDSLLLPDADAYYRKLQASKGEIPSPIDLPKGCFFHSRCPVARSECFTQYPAFVEMGPSHRVACFAINSDVGAAIQ